MKKALAFAILIAIIALASPISAQTIVKGCIVNERGETVEYVSIGFEEGDGENQSPSVGTISDAKGNFELEIPNNRKNDLVFTHVSFQKAVVPFETYANGQQLTVTMKDKVVELAEVVVGKKNKSHTLSGKSWIRTSTAGFEGDCKGDIEWGPIFKNRKDYLLTDIMVTIVKCEYEECTLSFNCYEVRDKKFVNVLNKPIYKRVTPADNGKQLSVGPAEPVVLRGKNKYCVTISVVDIKGKGRLSLPANFKSSYARHKVRGKMKKIPGCPMIIVKGYEVE